MKLSLSIYASAIPGAALFALSLTLLPLSAQAAEYACKVVTIGDQLGVVLVQADDKALAEGAAAGAEAFTFDNTRGTATSVVRCIDRRKEQFADYQFQQFFESIPL